MSRDCGASYIEAGAHYGEFSVGEKAAFGEQLIFVGSHPGVSWTPVERDRILAYITVTNNGPRAIRVFWDGPPPDFRIPSGLRPIRTATDQYTILLPGNSTTVVVGRALKVSYAPDADGGLIGDCAKGSYGLSWCCPTKWGETPQTADDAIVFTQITTPADVLPDPKPDTWYPFSKGQDGALNPDDYINKLPPVSAMASCPTKVVPPGVVVHDKNKIMAPPGNPWVNPD